MFLRVWSCQINVDFVGSGQMYKIQVYNKILNLATFADLQS